MSLKRRFFLLIPIAVLLVAIGITCLISAKPQPDENGIYEWNGYYAKSLGEYQENSVRNLARKFTQIQSLYLEENEDVFYALIPDKNYQLRESGYLDFDYDAMVETLQASVSGMEYIDLFDALTLEDYYKTDVHWRQESLDGVLDALGQGMDFTIELTGQTEHSYPSFAGTYAQFTEWNMPVEELIYLTDPVTQAASVRRFDDEAVYPVYPEEELTGESAYNVFLGGVSPIITVDSPAAATERRLILFGDSFSNSLIPLLLSEYRQVTMVDLRFISPAMLGDHLDFSDAEVLFLYSLPVANNSFMLK